ncbi:hypothetical protein LT85_2602 [Collimonas arenae]|uniref:Uncharacterized protein n=1 Tax=Collimonas arenae TaxID=279058 RepID=A0A0A1FDC6_9BURK|nr:hypothetical protein LT85_2602 [Collimonas arenae]
MPLNSTVRRLTAYRFFHFTPKLLAIARGSSFRIAQFVVLLIF